MEEEAAGGEEIGEHTAEVDCYDRPEGNAVAKIFGHYAPAQHTQSHAYIP